MAGLTQARMSRETRQKTIALPLAAGAKVWKGGIAAADTSTNTVKNGASGNANLIKIGEWAESVDNSAGTATINVLVDLDDEVIGRWYDNATGAGAVTQAANLFGYCYLQDDHTVTATAGGNSKAGRVWQVDSVKGVLVQSFMPSVN